MSNTIYFLEDDLLGYALAFGLLALLFYAVRGVHRRGEQEAKNRLLAAMYRSRKQKPTPSLEADFVPCPLHPEESVVMTESEGVITPCRKCK